jgi:hypothetical protein
LSLTADPIVIDSMEQTTPSNPPGEDDRWLENYRDIGARIVRSAELVWGVDGILTNVYSHKK